MKYKWCERSGVIDESGRQVQQLSLTTTKKMRRECGKVLVDFLNGQTTERAKQMSIEQNMKELSQAMKDDPAYAWSWHCNIAMAHYDEMTGAGYVNHESIHKIANKGAARFMKLVFDVDTSECKEYKAIFNAN